MASEVSIRVRATNEASGALRDAARDARALSTTVDDLRGSMATFDERAQAVKDDLSKFDTVVRQHKQSLRDLATEFGNASDEAARLDIGKKMDEIQGDLNRQLRGRRIKLDELVEIEDGHAAAERMLRGLEQGLMSRGMGKLAGIGATLGDSLGTGIGLGAAPSVISALGAAISAGAGAAGIGAGIALAIKSDAALQDAGKELGNDLFGAITQRAHTAFAEPIAREFQVLGRYGDEMVDQWGDAFDDLAPALEPFITSVADTVTELSGVIADIAGDSAPALAALSDGFEDIGDSLGGLLRNLTEETDENATALTMFTEVAASTIDVLSLLVSTAQTLVYPFEAIYGVSKKAGEGLGTMLSWFGAGSEGMREFRTVQVETTHAMYQGAEAAGQETSALQGLADQLKAQTDPAFALIAAQEGLADATSAYDKAVKKSGKSSDAAQDALIDLAKASLQVESAAEKAGGTFDGTVSPALRDVMHAAGITDDKIKGVEKAFKNAKAAGDKFEGKYTASVGQRGAEAARKAIQSAAAAARAYEGQYIAALKVKVSRIDAGFDGPQAKATGGVVGQAATGATSSGYTWVGEHGPELVSLPAGTRVQSNSDATRNPGISARGAAAGAMAGPVNPNINVALNVDGRHLAHLVVPIIQDWVTFTAGGNVNVLGGGS